MSKDQISPKEENMKRDILENIKEDILEEVQKEVKTTIINSTKEYKEELKEDLLEDINNAFMDKMDMEEKRILRSKNSSIFKRNVIILVLIGVILYFGYCLFDARYFDFMKSECERNGTCGVANTKEGETPDTPSNETEVVKDKKWYIENYGYLLDNVKLSLNADQVSAYYLYSTDRDISEMKSSVLLNLAYHQVNSKNIKTNSVSITVEGSVLKEAFEKVFGSTTYYNPTNFTYNCLNFKYNQEKDRFSADNKKCSTTTNKILEEIDDMYEDGNVLYMITNATIYNESESAFYTFDNLYEPTVTNVNENDLSINAKKLNRYQYQFKKVDDTYYLNSIVKLK